MKQASVTFTFFIVLLLCGCAHRYSGPNQLIVDGFELTEDSLLVVVKVNSTEFTGYHNACDDCIPWSFWYVHEAKILDVIKGDYKSEVITFAMLKHADYIKEIKSEWYIQLKMFDDAKDAKLLGTPYYVVNHGSEFALEHW